MVWLKSLARKARSWNKLDRTERDSFLKTIVLLPIVAVSLRTTGLKATQKLLARLSPSEDNVTDDRIKAIAKISRGVELAVSQSPIKGNCLKRSLVLWYLLRRHYIDSELRIGVRRDRGEFQAHAWVEYEGIVLNDRASVRQQFATFDRAIEVME